MKVRVGVMVKVRVWVIGYRVKVWVLGRVRVRVRLG